jgi:hypothetical protein
MNEIQRARRRIIASLPRGLTYAQVLAAISYSGTTSASEVTYATGKKYAVIKFLTSGTLTLSRELLVDIFCVGAGSGGGTRYGGGGGYTSNQSGVSLSSPVTVTIGAGGIGSSTTETGANGGTTSFGATLSALGGNGKNGGSGAGEGTINFALGGYLGGTDGSDGLGGSLKGIGQHTTTRAFAESDGELFSDGGSSVYNDSSANGTSGAQNSGAGGNRANAYEYKEATWRYTTGGNGGSGIVMIRVEIA